MLYIYLITLYIMYICMYIICYKLLCLKILISISNIYYCGINAFIIFFKITIKINLVMEY